MAAKAASDNNSGPDVTRPEVPVRRGDRRRGLTELLRSCMDRPWGIDKLYTWKHRLISGLILKADEGDLKALQEIWTRLEGKAGVGTTSQADTSNYPKEAVDEVLIATRAILGRHKALPKNGNGAADDDRDESERETEGDETAESGEEA